MRRNLKWRRNSLKMLLSRKDIKILWLIKIVAMKVSNQGHLLAKTPTPNLSIKLSKTKAR
jgi:hypothetical protein